MKPVLNATFELRHAEDQGVLRLFPPMYKHAHARTHSHQHKKTAEVRPRGSGCLLPLEIGVCVQTTSLGIRLTAQSLEHRKHLPNVEQFSSPQSRLHMGSRHCDVRAILRCIRLRTAHSPPPPTLSPPPSHPQFYLPFPQMKRLRSGRLTNARRYRARGPQIEREGDREAFF